MDKPVVAAYSGTFDPITNGHVDVITRAARMFSHMIVAVAKNSGKTPMFNMEERVDLCKQALSHVPNIEVLGWTELIVYLHRDRGVNVLVRGARGVGDFEYEKQMALMNRHLEPKVDTILLAPAPQYTQISSSLVREIARHGGDLTGLVPEVVVERIREKTT